MLFVTLGGLALFLLGLQLLVGALQQVAGAGARRVMAKATRSPWRALLTGAGVGAASQSGTATSIAALGLVTTGIMAVREGVAFSLGSQIGATLAIQLAAFRISAYAVPALGVGYFLGRWKRSSVAGGLLQGAGLLFLGLAVLVESMGAMLQSEAFVLALEVTERSPLAVAAVGFVLGTILTSSNAATALGLGLYAAGGIGLPAAVAYVAGGNAGGTVISIFAARDLGVGSVRVAVIHTLIKVAGAALVALLAEPFAALVLSLGGDERRHIANAHTLFNFGVALPGTLLAGAAAGLAARAYPTREVDAGPRYLDPTCIDQPAMALALARRETVRISDEVVAMAELAARCLRTGGRDAVAIAAREANMERLTRAVVSYLADVRRLHGHDPTSELLMALLTELETVGHLIRRLEQREAKLHAAGVDYSRSGRAELAGACDRLIDRMRGCFTALAIGDALLCRQVLEGRPGFERRIAELRLAHLARLEARLPSTRLSSTHHLEVLALLRQADACVTRVAGYLEGHAQPTSSVRGP